MMGRTYKPDPHGKRYKKTDPVTMKKAKDAVSKKSMSIRKAALHFKIPYTVLQRHISNPNVQKHGGPTVLKEAEENALVEKLQICAAWGYPLDFYGLRLIVKSYLDRLGRTVRKFKNNFPGPDFAAGFMKRHKETITVRFCQNIKRSRAAVSPEIINNYFDNLEETLQGIPPSNIVNYDETNLSNDPGKNKIITKRGCKYPERVVNQTKSAVSLMFAASGSDEILPCYVVYKAKNLYSSWVEGGPKLARYNVTSSGWFDTITFTDWIKSIAIPYFKKLEGEKVLIGDNLSSHLSSEIVSLCQENRIRFVFLPGNSTHLTQPLDIAFFRPLKVAWRKILLKWKNGPGMKEPSIPKSVFPRLLCQLFHAIEMNSATNVKSGFCKAGIIPIDRTKVLGMLPKEPVEDCTNQNLNQNLDGSFCDLLREMRYGDEKQPRKKKTGKKLNVQPGKSVQQEDSSSESCEFLEEAENLCEDAESDENDLENMSLNGNSNDNSEDKSDTENQTPQGTVEKFGHKFSNVFPINEIEIQQHDWLLVSFELENKKQPHPVLLIYDFIYVKLFAKSVKMSLWEHF